MLVNNQEVSARLSQAIEIVSCLFEQATGHDAYTRRKLAYYAVSTHYIRDFDPFPGLAIYGAPATGKTATLNILKAACGQVVTITGETTSDAALKACMKEANQGTLIIEEADSVTDRDIENILVTRYTRASADVKKMVSDGKEWRLEASATFGATIVHRRNLLRDPAMLRRVITVQTKRKQGTYLQVTDQTHTETFTQYKRLFGFHPTWPKVTNEWDVQPAILDCYKPLIALAKLIEDSDFLGELVKEMTGASSRLIEEENYLDPQVLLKVLITLVSNKIKTNVTTSRINIEVNKIEPAIRDEFGVSCPTLKLSANQRNRILREDLGFPIRSSHGRNRLYLDIPQLIKVCEDNAVEDDVLDEWKKALGINNGNPVPAEEATPSDEQGNSWEPEEK